MSNIETQAPNGGQETKREHRGWIAVDLDGTLAHYDGWKGADHIGEPVPLMVARVKAWLAEGKDVRIFTARVAGALELDNGSPTEAFREADRIQVMIGDWSEKHIGMRLRVTCVNDYGMIELYDDRCVFVFPNEGMTHKEHQGAMQAALLDIAKALEVRVATGMNFKDVADLCAQRARAGNPKANQAEAALALIDGSIDAIGYAIPSMQEHGRKDLVRAQQNIRRALPLLRELAGKK